MPAIIYLLISFLMLPMAQSAPLVWQAANGDTLQVTQLDNGEFWASLSLSDNHTASFADNELILLQVDQQQPVSLVHGLRSCGSPARAPQKVDYQFNRQDEDWLFQSRQPPAPLLAGFVIKVPVYPTIQADRRATVVDFPLQSADAPIWQQWQAATTITLHYSLDNATPVAVQFDVKQTYAQ